MMDKREIEERYEQLKEQDIREGTEKAELFLINLEIEEQDERWKKFGKYLESDQFKIDTELKLSEKAHERDKERSREGLTYRHLLFHPEIDRIQRMRRREGI